MTYLITGGSGFIGTNLCELLDEPVVFDIRPPQTDVEYMQGYIQNGLHDCPPTDGVIHLAAITGHRECYKNPNLAHAVNVVGTQNVLEYCRKNDVPCIFSSTCGVYGAKTIYTETKLEAERLCMDYAEKYGLPNVVLRLANVY